MNAVHYGERNWVCQSAGLQTLQVCNLHVPLPSCAWELNHLVVHGGLLNGRHQVAFRKSFETNIRRILFENQFLIPNASMVRCLCLEYEHVQTELPSNSSYCIVSTVEFHWTSIPSYNSIQMLNSINYQLDCTQLLPLSSCLIT